MNTKAERELAAMYETSVEVWSDEAIAEYFGISAAQVHMVYNRYMASQDR